MSKVKGSLLVSIEGMEIASIAYEHQDGAIREFFIMKGVAERNHDRFYALEELFRHSFSYGNFYQGFMYRSWPDFHADKALSQIKQNTFQLIQAFSQSPMLSMLAIENDFEKTETPRAHSGFCNPHGHIDFVGNVTGWETWHRRWYTAHQEDIDWSEAKNEWLPNQDGIIGILKRELLAKFMESNPPNKAQEMLDRIDDSAVVHEFHRQVMGRQGPNIHAYAERIGSEVCECNYYREEVELSVLEQQYAGGSFRKIYSLLNKDSKRQFISIDFVHGMFEFHDEKGEHKGEFRFDGSFNSEAETGHSLKCIEQWHRKIGG